MMSAGISFEACGRAVTGIDGAGVAEGSSGAGGRMIPSSISRDDEDEPGDEGTIVWWSCDGGMVDCCVS